MKESIYIKNLGPLKDIVIDDIRPLTVLIGESGSGKSLLMKTLVLFRYIYKMLNIRWYLKNSNVNDSKFTIGIKQLTPPELKQYFKPENKSLEVKYTVEINGRIHTVEYRDGKIDKKSTGSPIPFDDLIFLKESWISEMRNIIPEWEALGGASSRRLLDFYFQETYKDFQDATSLLSEIPLDYLDLSLKVSKANNGKKYNVVPKNGGYQPIEWRYSSSGIQTSSSIFTLVEYFSKEFSFKDAIRRSIFSYLYESDSLKEFNPQLEPMNMKKIVQIHIEEPEQNLFPDAQCRLMESLCKTAFSEDIQDREIRMIMATHSPYLVNYLNILLHQKNDNKCRVGYNDMAVYRLFNGRLQSLMAIGANGRRFVDTSDLTEQMERIMDEYDSLTR